MDIPVIYQFFLLIIACYFLSFQIMYSLAHVSGSYLALRLLLLPGVIIHESAHALACLLTFTPIENISFWDEAGGHVVHHKPKLAFISQPIISFAPFPVGLAGLIFIGTLIPNLAWWGAALMILLMVSIAATLAPSKTDFIHAIEGMIVFLALGIATYYFFPSALDAIEPLLKNIITHLQLVTAILAAIWLTSLFLQGVLRRIR